MTLRPWFAIVCVALLAAAPFAVLTLFFYVARAGWIDRVSNFLLAVATGAFVGLVGLWLSPIRRWERAAFTIPYVMVLIALMFIYSIPFECAFFGDCL
jgi:hypothetical protein